MASASKITAIMAAAALPLATGCGGSPAPTQAQSSNSPAQQAFAYARCIRAHGVPAFPDPQVTTTPGSVGIRQAVPAAAGLSPAFTAAQKACRNIMPAPGNGSGDNRGPHKQVLLVFAHCLRTHGVTGFPDPNASGQLTQEMISAAGVDIHTRAFFDAAKACVGVTHGAITMAQVATAINGHH
ncbi:MAG TPA: hypothetical protein VFI54_07165 [Solirubrobacteraceae bacterium]|nr:hypothetical protein [Solirubrobacteraceae bacterium]